MLRTKGYLVWHQANISDLLPPPHWPSGVPDLEMVFVGERGYFMYELRLLKELGKEIKLKLGATAAGEAKGSRTKFSEGLHQLLGYLDTGLYNEGYLVVPNATDRIEEVHKHGVGLVTWDEKGHPHFIKSSARHGGEGVEALKEVLKNVLEIMHIPVKD